MAITITNYGSFTGPVKINANRIQNALMNLLISQYVFADNIKGTYGELMDSAKTDGTLYGDTKMYLATDVLKTTEFLGDAEASNLLAVNRPKAPEVQYITMDIFRLIDITTDTLLSKQAFSDEFTFSQYNSVILGWLRETKRVYDATTYNQYIGCTESSVQTPRSIGIDAARANASSELEANRLEALEIATFFADLIDDMKDVSRAYNDYGFMRSYNPDELEIVVSNKFANKITKMDIPTLFGNTEGLDVTKMMRKLPARYFGRPITASDIGEGKVIGADGAYDSTKGTLRAAKEFDYNDAHYFPGDALATSGTYVAVVGGLEASSVYLEDPDKVAVVMHKRSVPYFSTYEVASEFINPRSKTINNYLHLGRNTLAYLKNYPFLVIKK